MVVDLAKLTTAIDAVADKPAPVDAANLENELQGLSAEQLADLREKIISGAKAQLPVNGGKLTVQLKVPGS